MACVKVIATNLHTNMPGICGAGRHRNSQILIQPVVCNWHRRNQNKDEDNNRHKLGLGKPINLPSFVTQCRSPYNCCLVVIQSAKPRCMQHRLVRPCRTCSLGCGKLLLCWVQISVVVQPGECIHLTLTSTGTSRRGILPYTVPISGAMSIWLNDAKAIPGTDEEHENWNVPLATFVDLAKVSWLTPCCAHLSLSLTRYQRL